jgi:hypothetical protein
MKFLSKKTLFLVFLGGLITATSLSSLWICGASNIFHHTRCVRLLDSLIISILFDITAFLVLALLPLLFTIPFHNRVFESWRNFALWAVPVTLVLSALLMLGGEGGSYFSYGFGPFILMLLYGAFVAVSLIVIIVAALKERKGKGEIK